MEDDHSRITINLTRFSGWYSGLETLSRMLSDQELDKASSYRFARDKKNSIVSRALLRYLLAPGPAHLARSFAFCYGTNGKPYLPGGPYFNVSHSADWLVLAIHSQFPIGIDVEHIDPDTDYLSLSERVFSDCERASLANAQHEQQQRQLFFNGWTRKEAAIKGTGTGLLTDLQRITTELSDGIKSMQVISDLGEFQAYHWQVLPFHVDDSAAAAVAVRTSGNVDLDVRHITPPLEELHPWVPTA